MSWIEKHGEITSKRMEATDVSRTLFDQDIALANLTMQDILGIEREMTRLRGEIDRAR